MTVTGGAVTGGDPLAHLAWKLTGSEGCLEILRRDAHRLAAAGG